MKLPKEEKISNPVISQEMLEKLRKSVEKPSAEPKVGVNTNPPPPTKPPKVVATNPAPKPPVQQQAPKPQQPQKKRFMSQEEYEASLTIEQRVDRLERRLKEIKNLIYKFRFIPMKQERR